MSPGSGGLYESLKPNQYVTVYYLPEDKSKAFMQGAYAIINPTDQPGAPRTLTVVSVAHGAALRFLAWTMVWLGVAAGVYGWFRPKSERKAAGPAVTLTKR